MRNNRLHGNAITGHCATCLLLVALVLPATAMADWKTDYKKAETALKDGNYAEAQRLFEAAAAAEGRPAKAKLGFPSGTFRDPYLPHYYAGFAAWKRGDCKTALDTAHWNHPASKAVIAGMNALNATQQQGITDCTQKLAGSMPAPTTPPINTPSTPAGTEVAQTTSIQPPQSPTIETRPVPPKPVPVVQQTPPPKPLEPTAPVALPAPAALRSAVDAWLEGRYNAIVQTNPATLGDAHSRALGLMLRAAARHTLAELDNGDVSQLELARADIRAARQAQSGLSPDDALFSPRFAAFWRVTR